MKIENGELSQFAKTAEGISYAFYDIRKNSDALDDLSRVVAKLDSDTLTTSELQEKAHARLAERVSKLGAEVTDLYNDMLRMDRKIEDRLDDIERRAIESAAVDTALALRICILEEDNLDTVQDIRGFDILAMEFSDMKGVVADLSKLVKGLAERMGEVERHAIESDQFARQVHTTASGNSVAVDTLARKLEESVDPLWEPVDEVDVGCTCGPCWVHARLVDKLEHMNAAEYKQPEEWRAYAGKMGDLCWNDPSKRCYPPNNTCATCVPVEEYTLGTSGEKLTGPFDPTPGEEWWYSLPLLMWQYNPAWDDLTPTYQPVVMSSPCEAPVCPKHMYSAGFGHTHKCTPDTDCIVCYPPEKAVILCGGMSLTARPDCPCSRCVQCFQGYLAKFGKMFSSWRAPVKTCYTCNESRRTELASCPVCHLDYLLP